MSTPAGQSVEQALHDRHRSRASRTSSDCHPSSTVRRAADHLLQHPGPAAGGVLLVPGGPVARTHHAAGCRCGSGPTPIQPCTAWTKGSTAAPADVPGHRFQQRSAAGVQRPRSKLVRQFRAPAHRARARLRVDRIRVRRCDPGFRMPAGSQICSERANAAMHPRRVHDRQQLRPGPAVTVLAGQ